MDRAAVQSRARLDHLALAIAPPLDPCARSALMRSSRSAPACERRIARRSGVRARARLDAIAADTAVLHEIVDGLAVRVA